MIQRRAAALTAAAVLALTGCSDDGGDQPRPLPSLTTPTPSTSSALAHPATEQGASQAAREYYEAAQASILSGDLTQWRERFLPSCSLCLNAAEAVEATYADGGRYEGGTVTVRAAGVIVLTATRAEVSVEYSVAAGRTFAGDGTVEQRPAIRAVQNEMVLSRQGAAWRVASLENVPL